MFEIVGVLIIKQDQVDQLLPMAECITVMEEVLARLARDDFQLPLRQVMWLPEKIGALALMPAYWKSRKMIGLKAVTFFPQNEGTELDTHQGAVLLYDGECGRLVAMVDGTSITSIRTAAVSGVATKLLSRPDSRKLAIIGTGVQARTHLEAMVAIRPIAHVMVFGKTSNHAVRFSKAASRRYGLPVEVAPSCQHAVADADIICTTTSSQEPVLRGEWLRPGSHINAIGSSMAFARELDGEAVRRSRLFVDRKESALHEAGDFLIARKEGIVGEDHIVGEVGEVLIDTVEGRKSPSDITLFKAVGLAVEDLAAAWHVYQKARQQGVGITVEFGGTRRETD